MCAVCDQGWCERHMSYQLRYQLDFDPYATSPDEDRQERWEWLISSPDYLKEFTA